MSINLNSICDCCNGTEDQGILQLFDNKCFGIAQGKEIINTFCLKDFAFPVDGHSCLGINIDIDGGSAVLFDNDSIELTQLVSGKAYARGIFLKLTYPTYDNNGDEILIADKGATLSIQNQAGDTTEYPMYNFFSIFTNPKSNDPESLINKIEIVNPQTTYPIRISGMVFFVNAE
jgi:hypothetical protein